MAIKDLQAREGNVDLVATIIDIGQPREFEKFGKKGRVASATIQDESGTMKLTLWNEQVDQVSVGDKIHVQKGYVNEYQGDRQLTTGKFGTLDIIGAGESPKQEGLDAFAPKEAEPVEETPKERPSPEPTPPKADDAELDSSDVEEEKM